MPDTFITSIQTPVGPIQIIGTNEFVTTVGFDMGIEDTSGEIPAVLLQCKQQLEEYFAGKRNTFSIELAPEGTDFQKKVWDELLKVDYGHTDTYMGIAKKLNNPGAVRAVGLANGKNPIAIIIPCHRIIGGDGTLTGYAGGMHRKQWLLEHEGNISGNKPTLF